MLLKKGQRTYLAKLKIKFKALFTDAFWIKILFFFLNIIMTKSFQFGLDKIADAFQKRAEELFSKS